MILNHHRAVENWGRHGQQILHLLATRGPASRERLHRWSGLHRSLVGDTVRRLVQDGLLQGLKPQVRGRGRPQTPMALDLQRRCILGVAIDPESVSMARVNLLGKLSQPPKRCHVSLGQDPLTLAADLIRLEANDPPLAIGVSMTGVVDNVRGTVLESSALLPGSGDLASLRSAAGQSLLVIENDLHALAQHWRMNERVDSDQDVLLVRLEDGAVAAAFVVRGKPHVGCVRAASELGHTRLAVATRKCYCGRCGCLERVFDSAFARDLDGDRATLAQRFASVGEFDSAARRIIELVGMGIANAVQLMKPHRLLVVSQFANHEAFRRRLADSIQREMLASFRDFVMIEWWNDPVPDGAVVAASSALAMILGDEPAPMHPVA